MKKESKKLSILRTCVGRSAGVHGPKGSQLGGDWKPSRLVLFRFPDRAAIHAFLADPDYAPLKALRQRSATTDVVAVDGIA